MPRASLAIENLRSAGSKFAIPEGLGKIVAATVAIEAIPGWNSSPLGCRITVQPLTKDLKATDDEPVTQFLVAANTATRDGEPLFHVGKASGPDDSEPDDLGADDETEGNCIWQASEELKLNKGTAMAAFSTSLQEHGFKAVLLNGYMPNLVGTVARFKQQPLQKSETAKNTPTALVVEQILTFPYDKKGAGTTASASAKPAAKSATKETTADEGDGGDDELDNKASLCMDKIGEAFAGQTVTRKKINTRLVVVFPKAKVSAKEQRGVQAKFADDEWFTAQAEARDWTVDGDNVTVAEA